MYAKVIDGAIQQYPYTLQQLYADHPNTTFPTNWTDELLALVGMVRVVVTGAPKHDPRTHYVVESTPVYNADKPRWEQAWVVREKTEAERVIDDTNKAEEIRRDRNSRLASSDWTQVLDAQVDRTAWAAYRQELRDITAQPGFPWTVTWPQEP